MLDWKRIGCGTDLSEPSRPAMREAAEIAGRVGADLELILVRGPQPSAEADWLIGSTNEGEGPVVELERELEAWREEAARIAGRAVDTTVIAGDPADELVRLARERPLDLVVVGTHGRTGLKRLVLGSVAERVVREAPCMVLVVREHPPRA